jgi:hypothetical protein
MAVLTALVAPLGCSNTPQGPTGPTVSVAGAPEAAADGSTLKVTAPTPLGPMNDDRLQNRRPTMQIANSSARFPDAHRDLAGSLAGISYQFELLDASNAHVSSSPHVAGGSGTTSYAYPQDLERDTQYRWRARAVLDGAVGPWSTPASFVTARQFRTPDPPPGQRLPLPNRFRVVQQVASQRPDLLSRSCQEHGGTWEFMDLLVDTLREEDTRWGYNCKRGNCGDPSLDVIAYHWGRGPDEGSPNVYAIDVIIQHCGDNPVPAWLDLTDPFGAGAAWTSRGRF